MRYLTTDLEKLLCHIQNTLEDECFSGGLYWFFTPTSYGWLKRSVSSAPEQLKTHVNYFRYQAVRNSLAIRNADNVDLTKFTAALEELFQELVSTGEFSGRDFWNTILKIIYVYLESGVNPYHD